MRLRGPRGSAPRRPGGDAKLGAGDQLRAAAETRHLDHGAGAPVGQDDRALLATVLSAARESGSRIGLRVDGAATSASRPSTRAGS